MEEKTADRDLLSADTPAASSSPAKDTQQAALVAEEPITRTVTNEPPDGGLKAWSVVIGGWCAMFVSVGWNNAAGVLQTIYQTDLLIEYSPSAIGWIISIQTFFMFVIAPITGQIFDSYGPRYILLGGSILQVLGVMTMGSSTQYWHFVLSQSLCTGVGGGAIFFASSNCIATWFKVNRAFAIGIASSGSAVGGVVIPIMINRIYRTAGFGWALRAVGFLFLGLVLITNAFIRSRLTHVPKPARVKAFAEPLQEPAFMFLTSACFFFAMAVYQPGTFIALNAAHQDVRPNIANYLLSMLNASSVFGRIAAGWLADRIGRFNCITLTTLLSGLFVLAAWIPATAAGSFIVFAVLVGFTNGAYVALTSACVAQISNIKQIGTRNGTNWFMYGIGALIGTPISGALITAGGGSYLYVKIFTGVAMMISGVLFIGSRYVQIGAKVFKWV